MRRAVRCLAGLCLAVAIAAAGQPAMAGFDEGVAAYDRGDYRAALDAWLPLARNGDAAAQRNVGHLYRRGLGAAPDAPAALEWYRRAAEAGLASAQLNLAVMYLQGQGTEADPHTAARWFHSAARAGHPVAQYNLGLMFAAGNGVPRDEARAMGWLHLAAKAGNKDALDALSRLVLAEPALPGDPPATTAAAPSAAPKPSPELERGGALDSIGNRMRDAASSIFTTRDDARMLREGGNPGSAD